MATNATWTVVFDDKLVIKQSGDAAGTSYKIDDNAFWATTTFQNIWAIQSGTSNSSDEVEHRDDTPHCSLADKGIDIQQFITKWDAMHLAKLQADWDNDNAQVEDPADSGTYRDETSSEKIARLGARPTSYLS